MTYTEIQKIFEEHKSCKWWEEFEYTDCRVNIAEEIARRSQNEISKTQQKREKLEIEPKQDLCQRIGHQLYMPVPKWIDCFNCDLHRPGELK